MAKTISLVSEVFQKHWNKAVSFGRTIGDRIRVGQFAEDVDAETDASLTAEQKKRLRSEALSRSGIGASQLGKARKLYKLGISYGVWDTVTLGLELVSNVLLLDGADARRGESPARWPLRSKAVLLAMQALDTSDSSYLKGSDAEAIVGYVNGLGAAEPSPEGMRSAIDKARELAAHLEALRRSEIEAAKGKPADTVEVGTTTPAEGAEEGATLVGMIDVIGIVQAYKDGTVDAKTAMDSLVGMLFPAVVEEAPEVTPEVTPEAVAPTAEAAPKVEAVASKRQSKKARKVARTMDLREIGDAIAQSEATTAQVAVAAG